VPVVWHSWLPSQQPLAHDDALQTQDDPLQTWPCLHDLHCIPPVPQADMPGVVTHTLPSQQPFGQDCGLQTHCPPLQVSPASHLMHALPAAPHALLPAV
jgi:hypothetical protein